MACDIRAGFLLRHRWLCSYGELQNAPSLMPQTHINIPAFFVSCKQLYSLALVAVHLPAAGAFRMDPVGAAGGRMLSDRGEPLPRHGLDAAAHQGHQAGGEIARKRIAANRGAD